MHAERGTRTMRHPWKTSSPTRSLPPKFDSVDLRRQLSVLGLSSYAVSPVRVRFPVVTKIASSNREDFKPHRQADTVLFPFLFASYAATLIHSVEKRVVMKRCDEVLDLEFNPFSVSCNKMLKWRYIYTQRQRISCQDASIGMLTIFCLISITWNLTLSFNSPLPYLSHFRWPHGMPHVSELNSPALFWILPNCAFGLLWLVLSLKKFSE